MQPQFFTAAQLAEASGRNEKTIRRAILAGRLPADKDDRGQYQIPAEAGFAVYPRKAPVGQVQDDAEDVLEPELDGSMPPVARTRELPGILEAARRILALPYSPENWAALRAVLQP